MNKTQVDGVYTPHRVVGVYTLLMNRQHPSTIATIQAIHKVVGVYTLSSEMITMMQSFFD